MLPYVLHSAMLLNCAGVSRLVLGDQVISVFPTTASLILTLTRSCAPWFEVLTWPAHRLILMQASAWGTYRCDSVSPRGVAERMHPAPPIWSRRTGFSRTSHADCLACLASGERGMEPLPPGASVLHKASAAIVAVGGGALSAREAVSGAAIVCTVTSSRDRRPANGSIPGPTS